MPPKGPKLTHSFYRQSDVLALSKAMLGCKVCRRTEEGHLYEGLIVETEAYRWYNDAANHARSGRKTGRTATMFKSGGIAYVYVCYGIHHLFNVVTNTADKPDAVLIRAVKPLGGLEQMCINRNMNTPDRRLTNGPGKWTQAFDIDRRLNGAPLTDSTVWIEKSETVITPADIAARPRVGIDYAGKDAANLWRFMLPGYQKWLSTSL